MSERAYLPLSYAASAVGYVVVSLLDAKSPAWREFTMTHYAVPMGLVTLAIAASRRDFPIAPALDRAAAAVWAMALLCLARWTPLVNVTEVNARLVDAVALAFGLASITLSFVFLQVLFGARSRQLSVAARALQAAGIGVLAFYFGRLGVLYYGSTRFVRSGGIEALGRELELHVFLSGAALLAMLGSVFAAWSGRRRLGR